MRVQDESKSAFEEWVKEKREQQKQTTRKEQEQRDKEVHTDTKKRSRKEAERAFKRWVEISTADLFGTIQCTDTGGAPCGLRGCKNRPAVVCIVIYFFNLLGSATECCYVDDLTVVLHVL